MPTDASSRESLARTGRNLRQSLGLPSDIHRECAPGFEGMFDELVFGAIWSRPGLELHDRMVAVVASLAALERESMLREYARSAVAAGVSASGVREIVLQAGLYTGFVSAETNLAVVNKMLGTPVQTDAAAAGPAPDADLLEAGIAVMEDIHGDRARAGYASGDGAPADLYDLATRYGYGLLWNRPGLDRRARLIVSVAVFATLEQHTQLVKFSTSAMSSGLSFEAIKEILMQIAPYCGFPRCLNALAALDTNR